MEGIQDNYFVVCIIGVIGMGFNLIRGIVSKKGKLMNPAGMENSMETSTFIRFRVLYVIMQAVMLVLFVIVSLYFKSYVVSIIGFFVGLLLPVVVAILFDTIVNRGKRKMEEQQGGYND